MVIAYLLLRRMLHSWWLLSHTDNVRSIQLASYDRNRRRVISEQWSEEELRRVCRDRTDDALQEDTACLHEGLTIQVSSLGTAPGAVGVDLCCRSPAS